MKKLFKQVEQLTEQSEEIFLDILTHDSKIKSLREKVPLRNIQYSIASLMREYAGLYSELGERIKEDDS